MFPKRFCFFGLAYFLIFFAQGIFAEQTGIFSNLVAGNQDVPWQNMRDLSWFNRQLKHKVNSLFNYDCELNFLIDGSTVDLDVSDKSPTRALAMIPNVLLNESRHDILTKLNSGAILEKPLSEYRMQNKYVVNKNRIGAFFSAYLEYKDCWFFLEVPLQFVQTQTKFFFETPVVKTDKNEFKPDLISKIDILKQNASQNNSHIVPASINISAGTSFLSSEIFKDAIFFRAGYPFNFSIGYRGVIELINSNTNSFVKLFGSILGEVFGGKKSLATTFAYNGLLSATYDGNIFLAERDFYPNERSFFNDYVSTRMCKTIEHEIDDNQTNYFEVGKTFLVEESDKVSIKTLCGLTFGRGGFYTTFGVLGNVCDKYSIDFVKENGHNRVLSNDYKLTHLTQPAVKQFSCLAQVVYEDKIEDNVGYSLRLGCQKDFFVVGSNMKYIMAWFGGGLTF